MLPLPEVVQSGEEITAATCVMRSTSNELSTPVSRSTKCKQIKADTKCIIILKLS